MVKIKFGKEKISFDMPEGNKKINEKDLQDAQLHVHAESKINSFLRKLFKKYNEHKFELASFPYKKKYLEIYLKNEPNKKESDLLTDEILEQLDKNFKSLEIKKIYFLKIK